VSLKAGAAKICITPPLGIPLGGDFIRPEATFVHDHLWARCLYLENGPSRLALVSCDLLGLRQDVFDKVLELLQASLGLLPYELILNCTHTHSGPDTPAIIHGPFDHPYMAELPSWIAQAILNAASDVRPAKVGSTVSELNGICTNRRIHVKGGGVRMNWETILPEEIEGYGPIDPALGVLRVDSEDGERIASVVHYTCHAAIVSPFPQQISADYPGLVCRTVDRFWGGITMFLNGAFGDINHIMVPGEYAALNKDAKALPFEEVERVGLPIALKALEMLPNINVADVSIGSAAKTLTLALRQPPYESPAEAEAEIRKQEARLKSAKQNDDHDEAWSALVDLTYARHAIQKLQSGETEEKMQIGAFKVGDLGVVCIPAETFVEIGFAIKNRSPFSKTWIAGITSAYTGYLPTSEAFDQGGYEVRTCGWSKWSQNADKAVANGALELLHELANKTLT
jgi:hypothetical protein